MRAVFQSEGCGRLYGTIGAALGLITLLYCTTTFNVILPSYSYSVHGVLNLAVLSFNTLLGLYCYLACVFVDPGSVPKGWQPEVEQPPSQPQLLEVKSDGSHRYCGKCQAYKPPRAHHCRRCGRCVLRMDHHCIWVNNCIGHGNYRVFLLMCCYLAAAALHATVLLLRYDLHLLSLLGKPPRGAAARLLAQHAQHSQRGGTAGAAAAAVKGTAAAGLQKAAHRMPGPGMTVRLSAAEALAVVAGQPGSRGLDWPGPFWLHAMAQVCASAVALPVTLALLGLLGWNLHLLLRNQTTIEHHEGVRVQLLLQGEPVEAAGGAPQAASKAAGTAGGRGGGMGSIGLQSSRNSSSGSLQALQKASKCTAGSGGSPAGSSASAPERTSVPAASSVPAGSGAVATTAGGGGVDERAEQERRQEEQQQQQPSVVAVAPPAAQPEVPPSKPPLPRRPVPVRQCKASRHPYDQGYYGNLRGVFGDWEALWCLPLRHGAQGDGLAFPTRQDAC